MKTQRYKYVVVGAGAAGCAVANSLSADPNNTVLLLEAGGPDKSILIHMPAGFTKLTSPSVNWGFETVPQKEMNNRPMHYPQGRTLIFAEMLWTLKNGRNWATMAGAMRMCCRTLKKLRITNYSMMNIMARAAR